jgi:hypothetical protein
MQLRESLMTLPTELIEEIVSYISYSDVAALAHTSKRLWQVTGSRITRSVVPRFSSADMRRCIHCLAGNPQMASRILEVHLVGFFPQRNLPRWCFSSIGRPLITTLDRLAPLPSIPIETLTRDFGQALRSMTHLHTLVIHSFQRDHIWDRTIFIPSLRKLLVYPGAESWNLMLWAMRQKNLTTLQHYWTYPYHIYSDSRHIVSSDVKTLQTLITDPGGANQFLFLLTVSDLTIHDVPQPSSVTINAKYSTRWNYPLHFWYPIIRSNRVAPLRRITLSGRVDGICDALQSLQTRHSVPPHVRVFFGKWLPKLGVVRSSP